MIQSIKCTNFICTFCTCVFGPNSYFSDICGTHNFSMSASKGLKFFSSDYHPLITCYQIGGLSKGQILIRDVYTYFGPHSCFFNICSTHEFWMSASKGPTLPWSLEEIKFLRSASKALKVFEQLVLPLNYMIQAEWPWIM